MWIFLVILHTVVKGIKSVIKKLACQNISVIEFLFVLTVLSLFIMLPSCGEAIKIEPKYYGLIAIKAGLLLAHEILSVVAIKKLALGTYGVLDLSRILFTTILSVTILKETLGVQYVIGLALICAGLLVVIILNKDHNENVNSNKVLLIVIVFFVSLINSLMDLYDKILMKDVTSVQVQFWHLVYLLIAYTVYILFTKSKIQLSLFKDKYMWIMAILSVISNQALLSAYKIPQSKVTIMTITGEMGCIISILAGKYIFKEKNTLIKLVSAAIVISGIVVCVV